MRAGVTSLCVVVTFLPSQGLVAVAGVVTTDVSCCGVCCCYCVWTTARSGDQVLSAQERTRFVHIEPDTRRRALPGVRARRDRYDPERARGGGAGTYCRRHARVVRKVALVPHWRTRWVGHRRGSARTTRSLRRSTGTLPSCRRVSRLSRVPTPSASHLHENVARNDELSEGEKRRRSGPFCTDTRVPASFYSASSLSRPFALQGTHNSACSLGDRVQEADLYSSVSALSLSSLFALTSASRAVISLNISWYFVTTRCSARFIAMVGRMCALRISRLLSPCDSNDGSRQVCRRPSQAPFCRTRNTHVPARQAPTLRRLSCRLPIRSLDAATTTCEPLKSTVVNDSRFNVVSDPIEPNKAHARVEGTHHVGTEIVETVDVFVLRQEARIRLDPNHPPTTKTTPTK